MINLLITQIFLSSRSYCIIPIFRIDHPSHPLKSPISNCKTIPRTHYNSIFWVRHIVKIRTIRISKTKSHNHTIIHIHIMFFTLSIQLTTIKLPNRFKRSIRCCIFNKRRLRIFQTISPCLFCIIYNIIKFFLSQIILTH